ncbi:MAG: hypothetical protein COB02_11560 [Candidatus Cloacimonadota bacterium]|nr:MAG: hypothetical protein COB02_11560 [Candidatus Cloacimonadota bacterium]
MTYFWLVFKLFIQESLIMKNSLKLVQWILHLFIIYTYFLIYAQFGFLASLKASSDVNLVKQIMPFMLLGALISGIWIRFFPPKKIQLNLSVSFILAFIASIISIYSFTFNAYLICSFIIGLSVSILTILTSASLFNFLRASEIIFVSAVSTGLSYFFCNIPMIHHSPISIKASIAALLCIIGLLNCLMTDYKAQKKSYRQIRAQSNRYFYLMSALFFVVLLIDSYSFSIIQNNPHLMKFSWAKDLCLMQGIFHLLGTIVAYFLLKDKNIHYLISLVMFLFCISIYQIGKENSFIYANIYAIAIAMYSTALISFPALANKNYETRIKLTADLYLFAGWIGSGLGIILGDGKTGVSFYFFISLLVIYLLVLLASSVLKSYSKMATFFIMSIFIQYAYSNDFIEKGRQVYINEGCINCHSQFIRPNTKDVINWGPIRNNHLKENPPLIGNRRIGPDLLNVGLRRSKEWNELHLKNPSEVSLNSIMPSYAHLFKNNNLSGSYLIEYLQSLGKDHLLKRLKVIKSWKAKGKPSKNGKFLYEQMCIQCHGSKGKGDGFISKKLMTKVADLSQKKYKFVKNKVDLAQIIKFGIVGTSMPGHEILSDEDILALLDYCLELQN